MTKKREFPRSAGPANPRKLPTGDQMRRAQIADALYKAHGKMNSAISAAAFEIISGADPDAIFHIVTIAVDTALQEAKAEMENLK